MKKEDVTRSCVQEIYKILKLGGIFVSQVPNFAYYKSEVYSFSKMENEELFSS